MVLCGAALPGQANTGERIDRFHADVTVQQDGTLLVSEQFQIHSEGQYFHYDTYRFLPVGIEDRWDSRYTSAANDEEVKAELLSARLNGKPISTTEEVNGATTRVELGKPLPEGEWTYELRYRVTGAVNVARDGGDKDALYWNALGHEWGLPVESATVTVRLPENLPWKDVTANAYLDKRGVRLTSDEAAGGPGRVDGASNTMTYTAHGLAAGESLAVVVKWPKGYVALPRPAIERRVSPLWLPLGAFCYYLLVWVAKARSPKLRAPALQDEAPRGMSPAEARYLRTGRSDCKSVASALADLAARGYISVECTKEECTVRRLREVDDVPLEEKFVYTKLLPKGVTERVVRKDDGRLLSDMVLGIQQSLTARVGARYFHWNAKYVMVGSLGSVAAGVWMASQYRPAGGPWLLSLWFLIFSLLLGTILAVTIVPLTTDVLDRRLTIRSAWPALVVLPIFLSAVGCVAYKVSDGSSALFGWSLLLLVATNVTCGVALRARTLEGAGRFIELEGYRCSLLKAERGARSEDKAFAIALDVQEHLGDELAEVMLGATTVR